MSTISEGTGRRLDFVMADGRAVSYPIPGEGKDGDSELAKLAAAVAVRSTVNPTGAPDPGLFVPARRVVYPPGLFRIDGSRTVGINLPASAGDLRFERFTRAIRTTRRLVTLAPDLAVDVPDALVVGPALQDWVVARDSMQCLVDLQEFVHNLGWIAELFCRALETPVYFLYVHPVGETVDESKGLIYSESAALPFSEALGGVEREFSRFHVMRLNDALELHGYYRQGAFPCSPPQTSPSLRMACANRLIARITADLGCAGAEAEMDEPAGLNQGSGTVPRTDPPVSFITIPVTGAFTDKRECRTIKLTRPASTLLYACASSSPPDYEIGDVDEGSAERGKALRMLGGRDGFERGTQLRILDWLERHRVPGAPRVMIIGDSIRMRIANATGYGLHAYSRLIGQCNIIHVTHNCGNSRVGVRFLDDWLKAGPDVLHINHGLHDVAVEAETGGLWYTSHSIDDYEEHLRFIAETALDRSVKLIWGLCTPVEEEWHKTIPGKHKKPRKIRRYNDDIRRYNDVAIKVMTEFGVQTTDLFTPLFEIGAHRVVVSDGVHLNNFGSAIAGQLVAEAILQVLAQHPAEDEEAVLEGRSARA